jgi:hypothetical protein
MLDKRIRIGYKRKGDRKLIKTGVFMRRKREPVSSDKRFRHSLSADYGPSERWQHTDYRLEPTECAGIWAARATVENVLDALFLQGLITDLQRDAGLRFKRDYRAARLEARVTSSYSPLRGSKNPLGPGSERSDKEEAAYRRWRKAMEALGARYGGLVIGFVCHDIMPPEAARTDTAVALDILIAWYGLGRPVSNKHIH